MNETESTHRSRSEWGLVTAGLIVAGIGVLLFLGQMDVVSNHDISRFWPLLIVAVGVSRTLSGGRENRIPGLIVLFMGLWMLATSLGVYGIHWGNSWPLTIAAVGLAKLLGGPIWAERIQGVLMAAVGGLLQAVLLDWVPLSLADAWPLILVVIGLSIMLGAFGGPRCRPSRGRRARRSAVQGPGGES
jgi:MFS family permease